MAMAIVREVTRGSKWCLERGAERILKKFVKLFAFVRVVIYGMDVVINTRFGSGDRNKVTESKETVSSIKANPS
jgi:hypothetical protein